MVCQVLGNVFAKSVMQLPLVCLCEEFRISSENVPTPGSHVVTQSFIRSIKGGQSGGCSHHLFITDPRQKSHPYQPQFGDHLSRAGASLQVDCIILDSMAPLNHNSPACNPQPCRGDLEDAGTQTDTTLDTVKHMDGTHTRFRLLQQLSCSFICGFIDTPHVFSIFIGFVYL